MFVSVTEWKSADQKGLASAINKAGYCREGAISRASALSRNRRNVDGSPILRLANQLRMESFFWNRFEKACLERDDLIQGLSLSPHDC